MAAPQPPAAGVVALAGCSEMVGTAGVAVLTLIEAVAVDMVPAVAVAVDMVTAMAAVAAGVVLMAQGPFHVLIQLLVALGYEDLEDIWELPALQAATLEEQRKGRVVIILCTLKMVNIAKQKHF